MVPIVPTQEYAEWFNALKAKDHQTVTRMVLLLEQMGIALSHPYSSKILNTSIPMRELRMTSKRREIRVFYCFDVVRQAVLLIGGHKGDDRFYDEYIPRAEKIWARYLTEGP